jgi:hypothetical protein
VTADRVHVVPTNDLVEHDSTLDCPCGPDWEVETGLVTHHSLDGREFAEPDYSGPEMPS